MPYKLCQLVVKDFYALKCLLLGFKLHHIKKQNMLFKSTGSAW